MKTNVNFILSKFDQKIVFRFLRQKICSSKHVNNFSELSNAALMTLSCMLNFIHKFCRNNNAYYVEKFAITIVGPLDVCLCLCVSNNS